MKHILILFIILLSGCKALKENIAETYFEKNPEELAEKCADKFPVKETFIEGETIVKTDTLTLPGDTVPCPPVEGKTTYVKCPDQKTIYVNTTKTDTIIKENTARVAQLTGENTLLRQQLEDTTEKEKEARKKAKNYFWILIVIAAVVVGGFVLKLKKII